MLHVFLDQYALLEQLAVDSAGPVARRIDGHEVELAGFHGLQPRGAVLVDLDGDTIEVVSTLAHVQVVPPISRVALVGDVAAKLHRPDAIGAAADGNVGHDLVKALGFAVRQPAPGPAEDWNAAYRQRQLAVGLLEAKAHGALVQYVEPCYLLQQRCVAGRGIGANQGLVAVLYVGSLHRVTVVKARLGPQAKRGAQPVIGHLHVLSQQTIRRGCLVHRGRQQGLEQQLAQVRRHRALHGERIVFVERGITQIAYHAQLSALGSVGLYVVEMCKARGVLQISPQRIPVRRPPRKRTHPQQKDQPIPHATILHHVEGPAA